MDNPQDQPCQCAGFLW